MCSDDINTATLFQNQDETITLLDLPLSISLSQDSSKESRRKRIVSSKPVERPYPPTEPKSAKARENVLSRIGALDGEHGYKETIEVGLREIRKHHKGRCCLPRHVSTATLSTRQRLKRKASNSSPPNDAIHEEPQEKPQEEPDIRPAHVATRYHESFSLKAEPTDNSFRDATAISNRIISHSGPTSTKISISSPPSTFHIPSQSDFFLANIDRNSANAWSRAILKRYPTPTASAGPGQFDFVLLDPPWQNRSVRRSKRYEAVGGQDPMIVLKDVLTHHLAPNALVGCWITNNRSARTAALEAFEAWGVHLFEEWIWLKVTENGEPVYDVEGTWRKPYEILLLGRLQDAGFENSMSADSKIRPPKIRLIAAVPDFHSRKPNLKNLIEPFLPDKDAYRALEVFARYLTSGWLAWGNEVLKFNWDGHWTDAG